MVENQSDNKVSAFRHQTYIHHILGSRPELYGSLFAAVGFHRRAVAKGSGCGVPRGQYRAGPRCPPPGGGA